MRGIWTLALLCAACTAANPNYHGGGGNGGGGAGGSGGGGGSGGDMAGPVDLSGNMGPCTAGERKCADATASDRCEAGMFVLDRACPSASECASTYCAPPAAMPLTQIGQRCDVGGAADSQCQASRTLLLACQPFVNPSTKMVQWFCDKPVGAGTAGAACTNGAQCRSGFCGSNGTCFRACVTAVDCPVATQKCDTVEIVVEGVRVQTGSCVP
jgi:hypothetical protein